MCLSLALSVLVSPSGSRPTVLISTRRSSPSPRHSPTWLSALLPPHPSPSATDVKGQCQPPSRPSAHSGTRPASQRRASSAPRFACVNAASAASVAAISSQKPKSAQTIDCLTTSPFYHGIKGLRCNRHSSNYVGESNAVHADTKRNPTLLRIDREAVRAD